MSYDVVAVINLVLLLALCLSVYRLWGRINNPVKRVEKLLDLAEKQGNITERQQGAVGRVIGEASEKAEQVAKVAKTTTERTEDNLKSYMLGQHANLRREMDKRFECMSKHIDAEFEAIKRLLAKLSDPEGVGN